MLKVQKPALGQGRPDTPGTATNLASALHEQGQFAAVVAMYCETLEVQAQVLALSTLIALKTDTTPASTLRTQWQPAAATALFREVLEVRSRMLGPEQPHTMEAATELAFKCSCGRLRVFSRSYPHPVDTRRRSTSGLLHKGHPGHSACKNHSLCRGPRGFRRGVAPW